MTQPTYKSETHQYLSTLAAQEAHTVPGVMNKVYPADFSQSTTHTIATLCLHKPWQQQQRPSHEPLHLEGMTNLPLACNIRTLSISETHSTSLLDEHPEALEGLEIPSEDQMPLEQYPSLISFPYNPQET